ncbi:MAG: GNAT family N-acetyltransferase [Anaerolineales bacterium]
MIIRKALPSDAEAIARVHLATWRTTYAGVIPDYFLKTLSIERRKQMWEEALQETREGHFLFVAEDESEVVGFVSTGPTREAPPGYEGEIYAIYLLEAYQGKGWGRQLFDRAKDALLQAGYTSMFLWVLAENPACGFYEKLGGVRVSERFVEIGGKELKEFSYGWPEL